MTIVIDPERPENSYEEMDTRIREIVDQVMSGFTRQFALPTVITELPQKRETPHERARGMQTAIEDLFLENDGSFRGFTLLYTREQRKHARHHKLDHFAAVNGSGGPREFDLTLRDEATGGIVLIELKWTATRNAPALIYEQAQDGVKLALALAQYGPCPLRPLPEGMETVVRGYVICGAYESAWGQTSVRDLFGLDSPCTAPREAISTEELWHRPIKLADPNFGGERNKGRTVGCDLHRGSKTARFKLAPDLLVTGSESVEAEFREAQELWITRIAAIEPKTDVSESTAIWRGLDSNRDESRQVHNPATWVKPIPHHVGDRGVESGACGHELCAVSW